MTARQVYEAILIELHKEHAPNIFLEDFNYLFNKAINQYVNKRYNIYDVNQQTTDDLRVLKASAVLPVYKCDDKYQVSENGLDLLDFLGASYEVILPTDYLHILNCICIYKVEQTHKCYDKGRPWRCPATRLTADAYSQIVDNFWLRPTYRRPYYYIHNVNLKETVKIPTDPRRNNFNNNPNIIGTDFSITNGEGNISNLTNTWLDNTNSINIFKVTDGNPDFMRINGLNKPISTVERAAEVRYGNTSTVRMEIRYGSDDSLFKLRKVLIDYIKVPLTIRLTLDLIDRTADTSQVLEFPDYVCQEIINELTIIVMENISDPKLQTFPVVSLSIANPAQQLTEPVALPTQ